MLVNRYFHSPSKQILLTYNFFPMLSMVFLVYFKQDCIFIDNIVAKLASLGLLVTDMIIFYTSGRKLAQIDLRRERGGEEGEGQGQGKRDKQ